MFSRFDNMMQHTQTHNHSRNKKNREKFTEHHESSKEPAAARRKQSRALPPPPLQTTMLTPPSSHQKLCSAKVVAGSWHSLPELPISPVSPTHNQWSYCQTCSSPQHSPASLVLSATSPPSSAEDEPLSPAPHSASTDRRMSVAELCNPVDEQPDVHSLFLPLEERVSLTQDEYEALQGFTRFQQV